MVKIGNGRVVIEVPAEKAFHYCTSMGYHIIQEDTVEEVEADKPAAPRRGRPRKAS